MRVYLVMCSDSKQAAAAHAKDLYTSERFRLCRRYCELQEARWFIISAQHGLLVPDALVEPYDADLRVLAIAARQEWAARVAHQLFRAVNPPFECVLLLDDSYSAEITRALRSRGVPVTTPFFGKNRSHQVAWLRTVLHESPRSAMLDQFYGLVDRLTEAYGGRRSLGESHAGMGWPERGLYFFFEPAEWRNDRRQLRVIRVGTHGVSTGSQATLWGRLRTHRGTANQSGSHRASVLRLHVGAALQRRDARYSHITSWGIGQTAAAGIRANESDLESAVSEYIARFQVVTLPVEDEPGPTSDRAYLEQGSIALLSGEEGPIDVASPDWLGHFSPTYAIRRSSMWNVDYVNYVAEGHFLEVFEEYTKVAEGRRSAPSKPMARANWRYVRGAARDTDQFNMF